MQSTSIILLIIFLMTHLPFYSDFSNNLETMIMGMRNSPKEQTESWRIPCLFSEQSNGSGKNRTGMSWVSNFRVFLFFFFPKKDYFLNMKVTQVNYLPLQVMLHMAEISFVKATPISCYVSHLPSWKTHILTLSFK